MSRNSEVTSFKYRWNRRGELFTFGCSAEASSQMFANLKIVRSKVPKGSQREKWRAFSRILRRRIIPRIMKRKRAETDKQRLRDTVGSDAVLSTTASSFGIVSSWMKCRRSGATQNFPDWCPPALPFSSWKMSYLIKTDSRKTPWKPQNLRI